MLYIAILIKYLKTYCHYFAINIVNIVHFDIERRNRQLISKKFIFSLNY